MWATPDVARAGGTSARRRRERRIRSFFRHEQMAIKFAVVSAQHHSSQRCCSVATQTGDGVPPVAACAASAASPLVEYVDPAPVMFQPSPMQRLLLLVTLRPHLPSPMQRQLQCSSTWRPLLCWSSHQHLLVLLLRPANSFVLPTPQQPLLLASTLTPMLWVLRRRSLVHFLTVKCLLGPVFFMFIMNILLQSLRSPSFSRCLMMMVTL